MRRLVLPFAACAVALAPIPHQVVERFYATRWYPHLQPLVTGASNAVPFAWLDLLAVLVPAALLVAAMHAWRRASGRWWSRAAAVVLLVAQAAAGLYLAFLMVWGFNYRRPPAADRLQVARERVTRARLAALGTLAVMRVNALHHPARTDARLTGEPLLAAMRPAFARAERMLGSTWRVTPGRPKASLIGRTFPLSGVDGMINPFGLEVILNPEVLPFERPFVLAHEWAHLAGHAPESEASFVAFLACLQGTRDAQYSGWLDLFLHVVRNVPRERGRGLYDILGAGPHADLDAIDARLRRVAPALHHVSWSVYDQYLRANRVDTGIANYDEVVTLVLGSRLLAPIIDY
jgi:hypothetical protein